MFHVNNISKKLILILLSNLTVNANQILKIDNHLELFIDNQGIESMRGDLKQVLIKPKPKEVVFRADEAWEGSRSHYWNLFKDDNGFRMYYRCAGIVKNNIIQNSCMAESDDGIHWKRPHLGLLWNGVNTNMTIDGREYDRSNILSSDRKANYTSDKFIKLRNAAHNLTVFKDTSPYAKKNERYKAFGRDGISLSLLSSKDGKIWTDVETAVPSNGKERFDSQNLLFWDSTIGKYRAYWREYDAGVRIIATATSNDALHWTDSSPLKYTTGTFSKERRLPSDYENLYTNAIQPYYRNPNLYIGFPTRFNPYTSQTEPTLMTSRDGVNFHRYLKPVISIHATPYRNSNRSNYMAAGMFEVPNSKNEISVYALEHYGYNDGGTRLRRFTYRTDGFVALHSSNNIGYLTTKTLSYKGNNLYINYVTRSGGYVRIRLLDSNENIIGISKKMVGDFVDKAVVWDKKPSLNRGNIKIIFELKKADLFSYKFDNDPKEQENNNITHSNKYILEYLAGEHGKIQGEAFQVLTDNSSDGTEVTAVADEGYHFVRWSDGKTEASRLDDAKNIKLTAIFEKDTVQPDIDTPNLYHIEYIAGEHGKIIGNQEQYLSSLSDDSTEVTAVANEGYHFLRWSDGKIEATRFDDAKNIKLTAIFEKDIAPSTKNTPYLYHIQYIAGEHGKIIGEQEQYLNSISEDTTEVTAIADKGYRFLRWSDGKTEATRFDDAKNMEVIALFESINNPVKQNYPYRIEYISGENGKIIGNQDQYLSSPSDDTTEVIAVADEGYHFLRWSDGKTEATRFDDAKNMEVIALFEKDTNID